MIYTNPINPIPVFESVTIAKLGVKITASNMDSFKLPTIKIPTKAKIPTICKIAESDKAAADKQI